MSFWDQSQYSLFMCGTSPSLHYWCLGLVPERHFLCLGPDNFITLSGPRNWKCLSGTSPRHQQLRLGLVPHMNNEYWDWSRRDIFYIWDQINWILRWVIIWSQTSKIAPWDWSHRVISNNWDQINWVLSFILQDIFMTSIYEIWNIHFYHHFWQCSHGCDIQTTGDSCCCS